MIGRFVVNGLLFLGLLGALTVTVVGWQELSSAAVWGRLLIGGGLVAALGIGALFFVPIELRANLTLTGAVTVLSLWVASWVVYEPPRSGAELRYQRLQDAAAEAGVPFDSRTPLQVLADLRAQEVDAYPPLSAWSLLGGGHVRDIPLPDGSVLPLAGPSRTTTVLCNENGEHLIVETDRYGFNNPQHAYESDSPIVLLGDSFAFGYCVRPGHDLAGQLRSEGVELVNLGYPGTGPLIHLANLREYGPVTRPSAILWFYYHGNDLRNLAGEYQHEPLRRYLDPDYRQGLPERQAEIDTFWAEHVDWESLRSEAEEPSPPLGDVLMLQPLRALLGGRGYDDPSVSRPDPEPEWFEATLDQLIADAEALGVPFYFVFLPTYGQFKDQDPRGRYDVLAAVRARGVPVVDFEERLRERGDPLQYYPFRQHGHFTEEGYALLVQQLLEELPLLARESHDDPSPFDSSLP